MANRPLLLNASTSVQAWTVETSIHPGSASIIKSMAVITDTDGSDIGLSWSLIAKANPSCTVMDPLLPDA